MNAPMQLSLIEPEAPEALAALKKHCSDALRAQEAADLWEACLCPGARDAAIREAERSIRLWTVNAIFLDLLLVSGEA